LWVQRWRHWKEKELKRVPWLVAFQGRGACWSSKMGIRKIDKQVNYSHELAQTKQQVGQCEVGTTLVHGWTTSKHELIRLTTARSWGEPTTFPLIVYSMHGHETSTQMWFCPRTPKWKSQNSQNWDSRDFGGS
jgi:hypothetical protein